MRDFVYICWKRREYIGCGRRDGPLESTPSTAEDGWIYVMKERENGFVPATYVEPRIWTLDPRKCITIMKATWQRGRYL